MLHRRTRQERFLVEHRQRPREHGRRVRAGVHADGVLGARLDAEAADDAAQLVDLEAHRVLLDGLVVVLARLDVDALGGAGGGAHVAGHAAGLAVGAGNQPVHAAVPGRIRLALLRVVDGGDHVHARALAVHDLVGRVAEAEQVLEEVLAEDRHALDGFADVEALAEAQVAPGAGARALVVRLVRVHAQCAAAVEEWLPGSALPVGARAESATKKRMAIHSTMPIQARPSRPPQSRTKAVMATFASETGSIIFQPSRMIWS